ncbi:uncharacterized protein [Typha latifolia]|uniref:uncharacterized protein n=1 Tax=Typha latifolia TaxID=4733 RepID=UPI003C2DD5A0
MGTQVQPKSYFPVFNPIRDLNEEMNCNRSLTYEDRAFNGKIYDNAKLTVVNDKDTLKRTMLEHEAVFRKQVYELHRLYQVQKKLMDELKKKQLYKFSLPLGASQSRHSDNRPLNFLKQENLLHSSSQTENGGSLEHDVLLNSKSKKIPRKVFDLHLPADAYIESEDAEEAEKQIVAESSFRSLDPLNMIYDAEPENSIKLTLGNSGNRIPIQGSRRPSIHPQKDLSVHNLADLNKPIENLCGEDQEFSKSSYSCGMKTYSKENEGQFNLKPSTNFVHKDFFIPMHREELSSSNFLEVDKEEGQKWPCLDKGAGQSRHNVNSLSSGFSCGKSPLSCKSIQIQLNKAHEVSLDNEDRDKAIHSVENSWTNFHLVNSGHSRVPAPQMTHSFSVVSQSSISGTVSPPVSSWRNPQNKISHIPIAVQALPCFNESTESKSTSANISHAGDSSGKLQLDGDVRSQTKFGNKSSYKNGHEHGSLSDSNSSVHLKFHPFTLAKPDINNRVDNSVYENSECHEHQKYSRNSHCTNIKFPDDVNLNQIIQTGHLNGLETQSNTLGKHADSSKDILMFRTNPAESTCIEEMRFSRSSHSISSCEKVVSGFVREEDYRKSYSLQSLLHSRSSSEVKEEKLQKNGTFDSLNNGVMGLTFLDKNSQSVNCLPSCQEQSLSDGMFARRNGRGTGARSDCLHFQTDMNVNAGKEKVSPPLPVPSVAPKPTCQIDLEAPTVALEEDHIYSEGEIIGMKYDEKTVQMYSTKKDGLRETELSLDTTLQAAAETIVSLSSYSFSSLFEINTQHVTTTSSSSLRWFAEFVTCNADYGGVQNTDDNGIKPSDNDGLDLFESMTLKLEEVKVDEYMCKPSGQENQNDQDIGSAALLLTKPRRVQARKRRQRRDFQKDILPGLASLSRHEVTEDLQILGGLTRSLGKSSQIVSARRAAGRNGFNCQPRGRRRPRTLAISVSEIHINTMPTLPSPADTETKGRNIMAWGRTTRRCRRQRLPLDHISAPQC